MTFNIAWLLPDCCPIAARLLPDCYLIATRLLPDCYLIADRLLTDCWLIAHWGITNQSKSSWSSYTWSDPVYKQFKFCLFFQKYKHSSLTLLYLFTFFSQVYLFFFDYCIFNIILYCTNHILFYLLFFTFYYYWHYVIMLLLTYITNASFFSFQILILLTSFFYILNITNIYFNYY